MHDARKLGLKVRHPGYGPVKVLNLAPGDKIPETKIAGARTVILKEGSESVLVRSVQQQPDGMFIGEICGFEPSIEIEHAAMKIGDQITFDESHVFSIGD